MRKVAVVQKQLESLVGESDMTLYTNETSKFGKSYGVFAVTDTAKTTYLLGLREMASKGAKTTLDTFHEILEDINEIFSLREEKNDENNKGYKILSGIKIQCHTELPRNSMSFLKNTDETSFPM